MFEHAVWQHDRLTLDGLVFRIEHHRTGDWTGGDDHFRFYKTQPLVDEYEAFFRRHDMHADNVFELGLWDGGSLAFWNEGLKPRKIVGVDIEDREDSANFRRYLDERGLRDGVRTYLANESGRRERITQYRRRRICRTARCRIRRRVSSLRADQSELRDTRSTSKSRFIAVRIRLRSDG